MFDTWTWWGPRFASFSFSRGGGPTGNNACTSLRLNHAARPSVLCRTRRDGSILQRPCCIFLCLLIYVFFCCARPNVVLLQGCFEACKPSAQIRARPKQNGELVSRWAEDAHCLGFGSGCCRRGALAVQGRDGRLLESVSRINPILRWASPPSDRVRLKRPPRFKARRSAEAPWSFDSGGVRLRRGFLSEGLRPRHAAGEGLTTTFLEEKRDGGRPASGPRERNERKSRVGPRSRAEPAQPCIAAA